MVEIGNKRVGKKPNRDKREEQSIIDKTLGKQMTLE